MNKIKDNINSELDNINFEISVDLIEKKAKLLRTNYNKTITTVVCLCVILSILYCGFINGKNTLIIESTTNEPATQTLLTENKNTFSITACAIETDNSLSIEENIENAEKTEIRENATVKVLQHRIVVEDFVANDGNIYHIFHIGETFEEPLNQNQTKVYSTEPIIYITGGTIKDVKFTADNVVLPKQTEVDKLYDKKNDNNKIYSSDMWYKSMPYTIVPLPEEFHELCIKCNETDYKFKFSDIPVTTITINITFENGEEIEKKVQTYYDEQGYFTVKNC